MANHDIITIGASAGGVEALIKLVAGLPGDLPASVFIVQHTAPASRGELAEVEMSRTESGNIGKLNEIGDLAPLTCSECGGPLWQLKDDKPTRFRCRVGHAFTAKTLAAEMSEAVERSLWVAVQMMDERVRTLEHLATTEEQKDHRRSAAAFRDRAAETREHTERLRQLLLSLNQ